MTERPRKRAARPAEGRKARDKHAIPDGEAGKNLGDYVDEPTEAQLGRPTQYRPEYVEQVEKLCKLGATDVDLADFFEVDIRTVQRWATRNDDFRRALKSGKDVADDRVERSLYQRAVGYSSQAVKIFMPAGCREPIYAPYVEHVPPDTTAAIFWLKNRRKDEWRDVSRQEQTGPNGGPIQHAMDLSNLSDNELARLLAPSDQTAAPKTSE